MGAAAPVLPVILAGGYFYGNISVCLRLRRTTDRFERHNFLALFTAI